MNFIFSIRFFKIALTSALVFVLDWLWMAAITSAWYGQTRGYLAELDLKGKIIFDISFGFCQQVAMYFISIAFLVNFLMNLV
jgi:hypothetical protein